MSIKTNPFSLTPHIASILAITVLFLLLTGCESTESKKASDSASENTGVSELKMAMLADMAHIISSDTELDHDVKTDTVKLAITPLRKNAEIQLAGDDSVTRPVAVSLQKAFEQSVMNMVNEGKVSEVTAIIHTRQPTTPLCNPVGKSLPETVHADMQHDSKRRKTIQDRTITLRQMARHGSPVELYIAYLEEGLNKRSPREQSIYQQEVHDDNNTSLHDTPLTCSTMPDEIVGASYILKTQQGHSLYFGNNGTQAVDGSGDNLWRYWFGSLSEAPVRDRYNEVAKYLQACGMNIQLK